LRPQAFGVLLAAAALEGASGLAMKLSVQTVRSQAK
jgi:hypothetical protein